jgi:ABC-2 type transport system permease protein
MIKEISVQHDASAAAKSATARVPIGSAIASYFDQLWGVAEAEIEKLVHDPVELVTRAVQPLLWLLLFGQVMARVRGLDTGALTYEDFLAPGILAQSVLFSAIFYGIAAIWERDLGVSQRYLVSPAPRSALVIGKATSSAVRGWAQALIVYLVILAMGADVSLDPWHILGAVVFIGLGSAFFSTFSLIIACIVRTRERFMGIGQVLTMPIFFASNAIYPISLMPRWLQWVSHVNPLTYQVDAMRALILAQGTATIGLVPDFAVLAVGCVVLTMVAARMYPRMGV